MKGKHLKTYFTSTKESATALMRASAQTMVSFKQRGFTIVEIMIVFAVMGSLAAIALPMYQGYVEKTRVAQAVSDISGISTHLEHFWIDNRQYPANLSAVLNPVPVDPWGNPYQYLAIDITPAPNRGAVRKDKSLNPLNSDFDLYSMGKDGLSSKPLTAARARDDVVRANNGRFIGLATDH